MAIREQSAHFTLLRKNHKESWRESIFKSMKKLKTFYRPNLLSMQPGQCGHRNNLPLELMSSQDATEDEMYEASLAFNSYWFATTYVDLAYYFQTEKGISWDEVDPKTVLSADYSSAPGYQTIKKEIGNIPGTENVGASCGA